MRPAPLLATLLLVAVPLAAETRLAISLNFVQTTDATTSVASDAVAGVVPVPRWNNVSADPANLVDSLGRAVPTSAFFDVITYVYVGQTDGTVSADHAMMRSFRGSIASCGLTFVGVPDAFVAEGYDVIVYFSNHDTTTRTPEFRLDGRSLYVRDGTPTWDGTHDESTATSAAAAVQGPEHVVFRDVRTSTFTLRAERGGGPQRVGFAGIQLVARGTAADVPPTAPAAASARVVASDRVLVTWSDRSTSETAFDVERVVGGVVTRVETLPAGSTAFLDTGLAPSTTATWRVRSRNAQGASATAAEITATTLAAGEVGAPRLHADAARLAAVRAAVAVPGSPHAAAWAAMRARVEADDWRLYDDNPSDGNWSYARAYLAREAALAYLISGDARHAQVAYRNVAAMYDQPDPDQRRPDDGYGLARAATGLGLAYTLDWALGGLESAQVARLAGWADDALDAWEVFSHANLGTPFASNWNAVCRGGELILMLASGQDERRAARYVQLKSWLRSHVDKAYGTSGWTPEGTGYADYAGIFLYPAVLALRSVGDTTLEASIARIKPWRLPMYAYSSILDPGSVDGNRRVLMSGVDGPAPANNEGFASVLLGLVVPEERAAYRFFYDRFNGLASPIPESRRWDATRAGTTWVLLYHPTDSLAVDPAASLGRMLADTGRGAWWFRREWRDADDALVGVMGDFVNDGQGWNTAEAFQVTLVARGTPWFSGPGKDVLDREFSTLLVNGSNEANTAHLGAAVRHEARAQGGYVVVGGGTKYQNLGLTRARRHVLVDFSGDAGAPVLLGVVDDVASATERTFTQNFNLGAPGGNLGLVASAVAEAGREAALVVAPSGAWLKAWPLAGAGAAVLPADSSAPLAFERVATAAVMPLVFLAGGAADPVPVARASGDGLVLGTRLVRWDGAADALVVEGAPPLGVVPSAWLASAGLPEAARGLALDPDGDGVPNALEYLLGADPSRAGPPEGLPAVTSAAGDSLELAWSRPADHDALAWRWEWSPNLVTWLAPGAPGAPVITETAETLPGGRVRHRVTVPLAPDGTRGWVRLRVGE